jgi:hypothetical protein
MTDRKAIENELDELLTFIGADHLRRLLRDQQRGPQGAPGVPGPRGIPGPQGQRGAAAVAGNAIADFHRDAYDRTVLLTIKPQQGPQIHITPERDANGLVVSAFIEVLTQN